MISRLRASRSAIVVLAIAWVFGQVKLEATIWLAGLDLSPLWLRAAVYGMAVAMTLGCYWTTKWAERRAVQWVHGAGS